MNQRYIQRYRLPDRQYITGAPVVFSAGQLLEDTKEFRLVAQLKWKCIAPASIAALRVSVSGLDETGAVVETAEFRYQQLAQRGQAFGQYSAIVLKNMAVTSIRVQMESVTYADGRVWTPADKEWMTLPAFEALELAEPLLSISRKQLPKGKYCYEQIVDLWYCTCGGVNKETETVCHRCGKKQEVVSKYAAPAQLALIQQGREEAAAKRAAEIEKAKQEAAAKAAAVKAAAEAKKAELAAKLEEKKQAKAAEKAETVSETEEVSADAASLPKKKTAAGSKKLLPILCAVVVIVAAAAVVPKFMGGSSSVGVNLGGDDVHVTTEYDIETFTLELEEDEHGEVRITLEDIQEYIPEAEYMEWEGTPPMGDDIDEYIRDGFHMARLIGTHGEEGSDDMYGVTSLQNDPDSTRRLLLFSDLTTLCGYAIDVPEKLGGGKWAVEVTRCDYDFTELYEQQHAAFYSREKYDFIPEDEVKKSGVDTFVYAYNMRNTAETQNMTQMYHLWQEANSPYLERHLRDFDDQWEKRAPQERNSEPRWRFYLLFDKEQNILGYTVRTTADADWLAQSNVSTPYDIGKVSLNLRQDEYGANLELAELQALIPETRSFEVYPVRNLNMTIDEYLKISQQIEMRVISGGTWNHEQQSTSMDIRNNESYMILLYSKDTTLCGYFVGDLKVTNGNEIWIDITHCDYDFAELCQTVAEDFSKQNWEKELKYIAPEDLENTKTEWFLNSDYISDNMENSRERHWYQLWSWYNSPARESAYTPIRYLAERADGMNYSTSTSMYVLLLDKNYEIIGYTVVTSK